MLADEILIVAVSHHSREPAFQPLRNPGYFLRGAAVHGTVAWPGEEDLCPDTLYLESVPLVCEAA